MKKSILSGSIAKLSQVMDGEKIIELALDVIDPDPEQPRKTFNQETLADMAASISDGGVIQPIVVTMRESRYMIVFGERRWRASKLAGKTSIPAIVRQYDDVTLQVARLTENSHRDAVEAIEEAKAIKKLIGSLGNRHGVQKLAAEKLGMKEVTLSQRLSLLEMPEAVEAAYVDGVIKDATTAVDVARVHAADPAAAAKLLEKAQAGDLNRNEVRETVKATKTKKREKAAEDKKTVRAPAEWNPEKPAGSVRCDKTVDMFRGAQSNDSTTTPPASLSVCQNPLNERQSAVLSALLDELADCANPLDSLAQVVRVALDRGQSFGFETSEILAAIDGSANTKEPGHGR